MNKTKIFDIIPEKIQKDAYIWNTVAGTINAFQSVIILMVLTRVLGLEEAGIFTIAWANANLFLMIGKFGMRNFHVTDIKEKFLFQEYYYSRLITTGIMIISCIIYQYYMRAILQYSWHKSIIIFTVCLLKAIDAIEDVFFGMYQQKGRLDIASKLLTIRLSVTISGFLVLVSFTKNQVFSLITITVVSFLIFVLLIKKTFSLFDYKKNKVKKQNIILLLKYNFSLFLSSFLSFYIGNASKYAIDKYLSNELQACYGFIAMPIFVVTLLNSFIYQPILTKMSFYWNEKNLKQFKKSIIKQTYYIAFLTLFVVIGGFFLGVPILSILYGVDLSIYKTELVLLLFGGGELAFCGFLVSILTIMRCQKIIGIGYLVVSIIAFFISPIMVQTYQLMGAAILYLVLMFIICVVFLILFIIKYKKYLLSNEI